ncbi:hypothetical protein KR067_012007, partial [Drosophila pandora]
CTSKHNCFTCKGRHNTLLHRADLPQLTTIQSNNNPTTSTIQSTTPTNVQSYLAAAIQGVLLSTAMINVCHLGVTYTARALLDSGSEATFITERLFRILKLPYQSVQARVSGLNQAVAAQSTKMCHFQIGSPIKPRLHIEAEAFVVPLLSGKLPSNAIPKEQLKDL